MSSFTELANAPIRDARRSLIWDWHEMNEAGCCTEDGPFCVESKAFAQGYLYAVSEAESAGFSLQDAHTCGGHPTDRCSACRHAKRLVHTPESGDERP